MHVLATSWLCAGMGPVSKMDPPVPYHGFHRKKTPVSGQGGDSRCCEMPWRQGTSLRCSLESRAGAELRKDQDLGSHLFAGYPRKVQLPTWGHGLWDGGAAPLGPAGTSGSRRLACGCSPCVRFSVCLEKCCEDHHPRDRGGESGKSQMTEKTC